MFPLGICYFTLLTTGFLLGLPLVSIFVGIPILVGLLVVVVALAAFERMILRTLLAVDIHPTPAEKTRGLWSRTKQLVTRLQTWTAVVYLLSEFAYGSVAFGVVGSLLATTVSFLLAPLYYESTSVVVFGPIPRTDITLQLLFGWDSLLVGLTTTFALGAWQIETLTSALLISALGFVLLLVSAKCINIVIWVWSHYARIMLTTPRY
ncbi:sensor domain-containing protein [Halocatena marina]|uniref:Sensor domain-containing protein n=1 Tax=Halocatena marina TaxID=2934937 RepID=A0ABD5YIM6_9EURY|nr:sensor domain-containing protein [Halocatena marina]